ncbi:transposase [Paeniroseomonas aquatica]|uniref:transposase n=1 Tax=Paeniroseomonas aquatica TaxID=373043 RepID=UPI0036158F78
MLPKLHAGTDGAGRILRLIASPGHHADLRYATTLASGIPACDAALDRGYVSAPLRAAFAAEGCTVHTPPKRGMVDPPGAHSTPGSDLSANQHNVPCREKSASTMETSQLASGMIPLNKTVKG